MGMHAGYVVVSMKGGGGVGIVDVCTCGLWSVRQRG